MTSTLPFEYPTQVGSASTVVFNVIVLGCSTINIIWFSNVVHPVLSVTVTLYDPLCNPVIELRIVLSNHITLYAPLPPDGFTVAEPSKVPLQLTLVTLMFANISDGSFIVVVNKSAHPFASVTVQL